MKFGRPPIERIPHMTTGGDLAGGKQDIQPIVRLIKFAPRVIDGVPIRQKARDRSGHKN